MLARQFPLLPSPFTVTNDRSFLDEEETTSYISSATLKFAPVANRSSRNLRRSLPRDRFSSFSRGICTGAVLRLATRLKRDADIRPWFCNCVTKRRKFRPIRYSWLRGFYKTDVVSLINLMEFRCSCLTLGLPNLYVMRNIPRLGDHNENGAAMVNTPRWEH